MPLDLRDVSRLSDMAVWARKAIALLGNLTYDEMMADEVHRLALVRCIEVIGEAGHGVSAKARTCLPSIPWQAMYGMRNRLIHDYGNTDYKVVYDVIKHDLPCLAASIEDVLEQKNPLL